MTIRELRLYFVELFSVFYLMRKMRWVMAMIWLIPCRLTRNVVLMVKGLNSPTREYRIQSNLHMIFMEKCIS